MAATTEEPILSRLDRLDNILRQLEDIRGGSRTPKSSCASTATSGTMTSDGHGHPSSFDFSPQSLEKHCRPIDDVIVETELKGTLIQRLLHVEERVLKLGLDLEKELEADKRIMEDDEMTTPDTDRSHEYDPSESNNNNNKKKKKKGLKQLVKSCVLRTHKNPD